MGRKKIIGDEDLLRLIDEYYETVCVRDGKRLKLPEICTFIRENGYPEYQDYILRRNKPALFICLQNTRCRKLSYKKQWQEGFDEGSYRT